ncbi:gem-associated protein 8 isoform X2 [Ambystoma mexicanum]
MYWLYRHKRAYKTAMSSLFFPPGSGPHNRYADWEGVDSAHSSFYNVQSRISHLPWPQHHLASHHSLKEQAAVESDSDTEDNEDAESDEEVIECDVSNMEITDELRQFFAQTERHREELRKQQQIDNELHDEMYIEADHDLHFVSGRSVQPPTERPGERRVAEMKKLYGDDSAKIQGMETAMQLSFDRNCDKKNPKYWPVIPLKL